MARRVRAPSDGPQLRAEILAELRETLSTLAGVPWVDNHLAAIERGDEVVLKRWDLPDWCPQQYAGRPGDPVILRADNTIAEVGE
ncbi:hypothetical protein Y900_024160 [Mycolicibacterium aromaticivorans JS19b1 = JCM 16368]|uniref:Uncharacterized protein n=1 Tax=Mycolicibacterium aromaticivorans JS19b1 = JCM 16368 TaxID=1440774 RepID=A0A064CQJ5_9MYCO|nr:hypothetical protein [Mycolicibacterium aromaticivorans]KDF01937.1 hypothetical protein Y900_024160 [Mycolicibacterium aromaticivorans JS19b1 = JCM 16368]